MNSNDTRRRVHDLWRRRSSESDTRRPHDRDEQADRGFGTLSDGEKANRLTESVWSPRRRPSSGHSADQADADRAVGEGLGSMSERFASGFEDAGREFFDAAGPRLRPVSFSRQRPSGRFSPAGTKSSSLGENVDRAPDGRFQSSDREVAHVRRRSEDGRFQEERRWSP